MTDAYLAVAFGTAAVALGLFLAWHIRRYDQLRQVDARDRAGDLAALQLAGWKIRQIIDSDKETQ